VGVLQIAGAVAALAAGVGGVVYLGRVAWRFVRKLGHFVDDMIGEPERDGQPGRPGVMRRLSRIEANMAGLNRRMSIVEAELRPNGGGSIKDQVTRIEQATGADRAA